MKNSISLTLGFTEEEIIDLCKKDKKLLEEVFDKIKKDKSEIENLI